MWLIAIGCLACVACDDGRSSSPGETTDVDPSTEERTETTGEAQDDEASNDEPQNERTTNSTSDAHDCPLVVLDPDPPLRVRAGPSSDTDERGRLDNGTIVQAVERREGFVRIAEPVAGWIFRGLLMRTCDAPPALPAMPLGERTYLLLPGASNEARPGAGIALPAPPMDPDFVAMRFSYRNARPVDPPAPITLVTANGSCERSASRRVLLVGTCPRDSYDGAYSTTIEALEVTSCPELHPPEDDPVHLAEPMMVGLVGHHEDARLRTWAHSGAPLTAGQRVALEREIRRTVAAMEPEDRATMTPEMPAAMVRFEGSRWAWVSLNEEHLLFHGDSLMGRLDMTAGFPRRVSDGTNLFAGIGNEGHHGYGFYMFPNEARRGLARESRYPTFSCAPH